MAADYDAVGVISSMDCKFGCGFLGLLVWIGRTCKSDRLVNAVSAKSGVL